MLASKKSFNDRYISVLYKLDIVSLLLKKEQIFLCIKWARKKIYIYSCAFHTRTDT